MILEPLIHKPDRGNRLIAQRNGKRHGLVSGALAEVEGRGLDGDDGVGDEGLEREPHRTAL